MTPAAQVDLPRAVAEGVLALGSVRVDCYVLDDGRRVLSQRGILRALELGAKDGKLARLLERLPHDSGGLSLGPNFAFRTGRGPVAHGREGTFLVALCNAYVAAHFDGKLRKSQQPIARAASALLRAISAVGIEALIDEATGHQATRPGDHLRRRFDVFLRREADVWERRFSQDLVRAICRLYGHPYEGGRFPPFLRGIFSKLYDLVLGDDVSRELRVRNPLPQKGHNHHQLLQAPAQRIIENDLRVVTALAEQCACPAEFWARLGAYFRHEPYQLAFSRFSEPRTQRHPPCGCEAP
jgi:hypothetical protein